MTRKEAMINGRLSTVEQEEGKRIGDHHLSMTFLSFSSSSFES